jgi:hypothetical protein
MEDGRCKPASTARHWRQQEDQDMTGDVRGGIMK